MHKYLLALALFSSALFGETIGPVEYTFPGSVQDWEIVDELNEDETIFYLYSRLTNDGNEFFGVNFEPSSSTLPTKGDIIKEFKNAYPDSDIHVKILDSNKFSILFEWSISENKDFLVQGLGRIISSKEGAVSLNYATCIEKIPTASRRYWIKLFKEAALK